MRPGIGGATGVVDPAAFRVRRTSGDADTLAIDRVTRWMSVATADRAASGCADVLGRPQDARSQRAFNPFANCSNEGPRSGIERQIIGSIGPVYSSRMVNLVASPSLREREGAHALEQPERHAAVPHHPLGRRELGDLHGEGALRVRLRGDLDLLLRRDPPLDGHHAQRPTPRTRGRR